MIFASYLTFAVCSLFAFSNGLAACEHVCFGAQRRPGSSLVLTDSVESLQLFRPGHKGEHLIGTECRDRGFRFGQGCRDTLSACCVCMFCFVTVVPSHTTHCNPHKALRPPTLRILVIAVMHNKTATISVQWLIIALYILGILK